VVEALSRNARYAIRSLSRTPGFTITVVATLALGIGANSAVFSAIDAILVRPLPYVEPDRLVHVTEVRDEAETSIAAARLEDWNAQSSSFEAITGYFTEDVSETTGEEPTRVRWAGVAPDFLQVWRVAPLMGRDFVPADSAQRPTVVIISERLWRNRFGADPNVLERTIRLGDPVGFPFQIVGVLPSSFLFPDRDVDVWFPDFTNFTLGRNRGFVRYTGVGRLRAGVTLEQARADMNGVQTRLAEQYPDSDADVGIRLRPLKDMIVGGSRGSLWLVFGAVSLLLLIACANIAALLLARATQRERDVAVRYSLGATRRSVASQTLTEAAVLAFAGALVGVAVASSASAAFRVLAPDLPRLDEVGLDWRILTYTAASTIVVALLCGLFPAARDLKRAESLAHAGRAQLSTHHGLQWSLVGVQVALSVALLAGAGLLLRSFEALSRVDPGFEPARVLAFRVSASNFEFVNTDVPGRINRTLTELGALPGVESAGVTGVLPGVGAITSREIDVAEGGAEIDPILAEYRNMSPGYFASVGVPVLTGELCRAPADAFEPGRAEEAMVNQAFAARYFPTRSPIGLHLAGGRSARITGIVGDARESGMTSAPVPSVYVCVATSGATPWFLLRTTGAPAALMPTVRARLRELEPTRTVYDFAPLDDHIGNAHAESRLRTMLLTLFAGTALALACLGIYGTLAYVVSLRRREVGLRVALGAHSRDIVAQFLARALRVVGVACAAGLLLALAFTRLLSSMLFGVSPSDPMTLSMVIAVVVGAAVLAAILPAARAARIDPMQALREE
jgi:putative ABC transport system permease protein